MKKHGEISTYFFLKHRSGKKSAIFRTVYPNRTHVTTHPVDCFICPNLLQILPGNVRRIVVAITDDNIQETEFLAIS